MSSRILVKQTEEDRSHVHDNNNEEEVIMIDDVSSNEGVIERTVRNDSVDTSHDTADTSHDTAHIDLEHDEDSDDVNIVMEKFIDQSSDLSSAE